MTFELSASLAAALKGLECVGAGRRHDEQSGLVALHFICDFVPERAGDADAILEVARAMLPTSSDAQLAIIAAQAAILQGHAEAALMALSEAAGVLRNEGAALAERLVLNVAAGPLPVVATYRHALPWELTTLH